MSEHPAVKHETPHTDLGEDAYHEWWLEARRVYRDRIGRRNQGSTAWLTVRCNNPNCSGAAIVRADDVQQFVVRAVEAAR